jgi:hypothetical protein
METTKEQVEVTEFSDRTGATLSFRNGKWFIIFKTTTREKEIEMNGKKFRVTACDCYQLTDKNFLEEWALF